MTSNGNVYYAHKISVENDRNGNPRRGWMIYSAEGRYVGFADEGYRGWKALTNVAAMLAGWNCRPGEHGTDSDGRERGQSNGDGTYSAPGAPGSHAVRVVPLGETYAINSEYTRLVRNSENEYSQTAF
jgi:hypothetical protein